MPLTIRAFEPCDTARLIDLSMKAWAPVFRELKPAVQDYVYQAFYPNGWQERQKADVERLLATEGQNVFVACLGDDVAGFIGIRFHPEDSMGEIYIFAVDPSFQRRGVARALMDFAMGKLRESGLSMVMVETGDDPGHRVSRAAYESVGFERWPVARYFRKL